MRTASELLLEKRIMKNSENEKIVRYLRGSKSGETSVESLGLSRNNVNRFHILRSLQRV